MAEFDPKFLTLIPDYDGKQETLHDFIAACELIIEQFYSFDNPAYFNNKCVLLSIRKTI